MEQKVLKIKVVNESCNELPKYETIGAAGMDLRVDLRDFKQIKTKGAVRFGNGNTIILDPQSRAILPTNLSVEIPYPNKASIKPRSGLSFETGLFVYEGTIDSDYRGKIGIIVSNYTNEPIQINNCDRVAQILTDGNNRIEWVQVEKLSETYRGNNGFGHTGKN